MGVRETQAADRSCRWSFGVGPTFFFFLNNRLTGPVLGFVPLASKFAALFTVSPTEADIRRGIWGVIERR
jgi:hypothetical protein